MTMWKIGTVASVTEGWGFNLTDGRGGPLVAFAYEPHGEAVVAARHVETAVEKALAIHPMSQDESQAPRWTADDAPPTRRPAQQVRRCFDLPEVNRVRLSSLR